MFLAFVTMLLLVLEPCLAFAQSPAPAIQIGSVTAQGSIRTRVEGWDWFKAPGTENTYAFSGTLFRLSFSQRRQNYDWTFEIAAPLLLGLPDHAIAQAPQGQLGLGASYFAANHSSQNTAMMFPKQAFVSFRRPGWGNGQSLQIGRFEFLDGSEVTPPNPTLAALKRDRIAQRLIGNFGFSDVERSFDGLHYVNARPTVNFTVVGAIPTRGVFQTDGWGWLHTGLAYAALTGQVREKKKNPGEWRVFGIYYDDWRHILKTDNRPLGQRQKDMGNIRLGTIGGHYLQAFETRAGTVDLMSWGALQTGAWGHLADRAGAVDGETGLQPNILNAVRPWLRIGYLYGSGDGDPADNKHGTFFQILPTPRPYARFPFFNLMNNEDAFGELVLRPAKIVTIRSDIHTLRLANSHDLWYSGGGAFQPWTFGYTGRPSNGARGLATLYDTSVDYQPGRSVTLGLYYGYAQGKSVIQRIYLGSANGQLGFLEVTYRF